MVLGLGSRGQGGGAPFFWPICRVDSSPTAGPPVSCPLKGQGQRERGCGGLRAFVQCQALCQLLRTPAGEALSVLPSLGTFVVHVCWVRAVGEGEAGGCAGRKRKLEVRGTPQAGELWDRMLALGARAGREQSRP